MLQRSATRAVMFAGAVTLALAAPAHAAVVEWQAGPVNLAAGQAAQVAISNPDLFACRVGVQVTAGPAGRILPGVTTAAMALVVNTFQSPCQLPAGGLCVVGISDREIMPGERRLLTARVRADCRSATTAQIRSGLGVTVGISDPDLATASIVLQAETR